MSKGKQRIFIMALVAVSMAVLFLPNSATLAVNEKAQELVNVQIRPDVPRSSSAVLVRQDSMRGFKELNTSQHTQKLDELSVNHEQNAVADSEYCMTWNEFDVGNIKTPGMLNVFRSVTLSISSLTSRKISISASALSRARMNRIGVSAVRLERYCNGRWMTVYGRGNVYSYSSNNFYLSTTCSGLVRNGYYRLSATFSSTVGSITTRVTRTTGMIRCR